MKLETEFRVRLQLMQLEQSLKMTTVLPASEVLSQFEPEPSTWVKLVQPPSVFSADEALLLCQCSETQWLAWVPEYGEIVLDIDEFYELSE